MLQLKSEGSRGISNEFIKDLYVDAKGGLKTYIEEKNRLMFAELVKVYEQGQEEGWVRKDLNIPFFMKYTLKAIEMVSSEELLTFFEDPQLMIMEVTNLFIYGISPRKSYHASA